MEMETRYMVRILMDGNEAGVLYNALDIYKGQIEEDPNCPLDPDEKAMLTKFVTMLEDFV